MECPVCGRTNLYREEADVGVCMVYGPWECECGWSQDDELKDMLK